MTSIDLQLNFNASFLSDCIIISYEVSEFRQDFLQLHYILNHLSEFVFDITLYFGKFMRGGFTYGDLYHEEDVCFGPALIEAVELEKAAIFPRISVSPQILDYASADFPFKFLELEKDRDMKRPFAYIQREALSTDLTGQKPIHYIDFLWRCLPADETAAIRLAEKVLYHDFAGGCYCGKTMFEMQ